MIRWTRMNWLASAVLGTTCLLVGCEAEGPAERAGEKIDQAADDLRDAVDPRGPAEKAGEKIDEAADNARDALDPRGPAEKAGEKIDNATSNPTP